MKMRRTMQAGIAITALFVGAMGAMAAQDAMRAYYANDPVGRNVVSIESRAPLETILTRTSNVTGEIHVNPANVLDNPQARFELDTATLDNGIALRNEHMKSAMWLDVAKYPKAIFTLTRVARQSREPVLTNIPTIGTLFSTALPSVEGKVLTIQAEGTMELHGTTKPVTAQIEVTPTAGSKETEHRLKGDLLHVRATFQIKLSDFGINVPPMAQAEVSDTQTVTADIFTSTETAPPSTDAPKS